MNDFQVAVIGSGFGGSLMAMIARRLGFTATLLERGTHPRFAIGESTTPLTNLLLEEISKRYDLPAIRPLCKWGAWQRQLPHLACGLKRGFTFYHHELDGDPQTKPSDQCQLMVGASPRDEVADTHWYRPDFDHYLVGQAQALGVEYKDKVELTEAAETSCGMRLRGRRDGCEFELSADFVIDATGLRGFLFRALGLPEKALPGLPRTQALFSHFTNVEPLPEEFFRLKGRTPPYPPENAAVHHVFRGGWVWMLRFNNGITSAGVAATDPLAKELELSSGAPAWERLTRRLPVLGKMFRSAQAVAPFVHQPRLAFESGQLAGKRWVLLPSAAGVVDPLLSTGFPLNLSGILRIAEVLKSFFRDSSFKEALASYASITPLELETTAALVGALYAAMDRFDLFKALSRLYFAAASFSEVARRLGKPGLADGFLLCRNPEFQPRLTEICATARGELSASESAALKRQILDLIAPFDLAGLTDSSRDPWYPARGEDILRNAAKLGATKEELAALFT
ncbi:MAG: NAD(P)/FAD-dependent oxidoreductase [Limisphaerales bacterium]